MHIIAREGFVKANPIWKPYKGTLQIKLNYRFGTRISFNFSLFLELLKLFSKPHWNKIFVLYLLFFHLNLCIYAITSFSFFYSSSPSLSVPPSLSLFPYPFPPHIILLSAPNSIMSKTIFKAQTPTNELQTSQIQ